MPVCNKCSSETHEQEDCPTWDQASSLRAAGIDITAVQIREMDEAGRQTRTCPTTSPEPHELGEFPMTCYRCHVEADS